MFIQVIQGKVKDEAGLRGCIERWQRDLQPGAVGYLGTTAGTSDDGTFIALVRFESGEAAQQNGDRPEQSAWWAETARCFDGEVSFLDCPDVRQWLDGVSDDAGFVQIMEGHSSDPNRMHELMTQYADRIHELRPEIIGGLMLTFGEDGYVDAVYFRSEAEARARESLEMPDDMRSIFEEESALMGEVVYYDLHQPMLVSAGR